MALLMPSLIPPSKSSTHNLLFSLPLDLSSSLHFNVIINGFFDSSSILLYKMPNSSFRPLQKLILRHHSISQPIPQMMYVKTRIRIPVIMMNTPLEQKRTDLDCSLKENTLNNGTLVVRHINALIVVQ